MTRKRRGSVVETTLPERGVPRRLRVESDMRELLVLSLGELRDPRLAGATVTRVEMSDDLGFARVWVRGSLGTDEAGQRELMRALARASGRLRGTVARDIGLRRAPELRFQYDEGYDAADRVDKLLLEIRHEDEERAAPSADDE